MWKNKKKLLFLLAFSSLLIAQNSSDTTPGSDQLESAMTKNISSGLTNQKNYGEAEKYYRMGADREDISSIINLGRLQYFFLNNHKAGEKYLKKAAEMGSKEAQDILDGLNIEY